MADRIRAGDEPGAFAALEAAVDDPVLRRSVSAMLRDTVTTNMIHAGKKMNVIPGSGEAQVDVRTLPGTDQPTLLAEMQATVGDAGQGRVGDDAAGGRGSERRADRCASCATPSFAPTPRRWSLR